MYIYIIPVGYIFTPHVSYGYNRAMKVFLSNQGNLRNFHSFIGAMDLSNSGELDISTHSKWITVHPGNLVLTASLALEAGKANTRIIGNMPDSGLYLDRMGLYDLTSTESPFVYDKKESSGRFVPLSVIKTPEDQSRFIADMIPLLHLPEQSSTVIKYVIGELVRNVLEHSQAPRGAIVAAQYYKKTNRISFGICDTGVGIWSSINRSWSPTTDMDAIRLSLMPGISGTTTREGGTSENAGAGLFFIKSIAKMTRSYFVMYSGGAVYTLLKHRSDIKGAPRLLSDPFKDRHSKSSSVPRFNGTLVVVDISLDDTPELASLLSSIGDVYDEAIRQRKRTKYKEPRFI